MSSTRMNVLFITPYEGMMKDVERISLDYPLLRTTVRTANEQLGQLAALNSMSSGYDCIISRGNTAALIRQAVAMPVLEVRFTLDDVLDSMSGVNAAGKTVAAVGYNSVVRGMELLSPYLPFTLAVRGFDSLSELSDIMNGLKRLGAAVVLCDTITFEYAVKKGMNARLLMSGDGSIRYAFDQAMQMMQTSRSILEENRMLRQLARLNSESHTVVFSEDRKLYYSTLSEKEHPVLEQLLERLEDFGSRDSFSIRKQSAGSLYRSSARKVSFGDSTYYAFFINRRPAGLQNLLSGIHYMTSEDVTAALSDNAFGTGNLDEYITPQLIHALKRGSPVLIFGEVGVGKNHLAELLFLRQGNTSSPFVLVDFPSVSRHTWNYLINRDTSPLYDSDNTIFLKNVDALSGQQLEQLTAVLTDADVSKRNQIFISCSDRREMGKSVDLLDLVNQLSCVAIHMLPLRGRPEMIRKAASLLFEASGKGTRVEKGAMELMEHFNWPRNYDQLIRICHRLEQEAEDGTVSRELVSSLLTAEMLVAQGDNVRTADTFLDLSKDLESINRDVAAIVLEHNGGNQSRTAKSLGISRTTLWRMLKEDEG